MGKRSREARSEERYHRLYTPTGKRGRTLRESGLFKFGPGHAHSLVNNEDVRLLRKLRQQQKQDSPLGFGVLPGWFFH